ncbi:ABC transporter permease [Planotetraspora phitsanulokensis]|uniref:Peptide ABC transporter permease n=1 Tax=Planotetraspora phitsanulokensis TaxID=575192 RepID=A0A8J3UB45_9ACTN|nr:ABC transporter permease [Planotetraspora phitsanulokensis]GII41590.1 peptide ABC transporter permease [Planotetraspora phitsanulokensis]
MSALTATGAVLPRASRVRLRPGLILAGLFVAAVVVAALVPQLLAPHDPLQIGAEGAFLPPGGSHLLGTDESGRDVLSRMVYGARPSLVMGLGATAIAVTGGAVLGLAAGLGSRLTESLIMRLIDVVLSIPELLLALVVITLAGAGSTNAMFAVAFAGIPSYARIVRAQTHIVRRSTFVEAATGLGIPRSTVVWRHVLPNAIRPVLVLSTIGVGSAISAGAALSFLGLGAEPPAAEWGDMLSNGLQYISNDWFLVAVPSVAITLTVLSITVLGRELRRRSEGRTT